jgi:hypothetical protein
MSEQTLPEFDPALQFPSAHLDLQERWGRAYDLLVGAERAGVLDMPSRPLHKDLVPGKDSAHMEDLPPASDMNAVRLPVIARQLFLLGYLKDAMDDRSPALVGKSRSFRDAVGRFQEEAGISVDGWVGQQTWQALGALVSFETDTQICRWRRSDGSYCRAFRRAVQLRLFCYGLAGNAPRGAFSTVPAINLDRARATLLKLSAFENSAPDRENLYKVLFDTDRLLMLATAAMAGPLDDDPRLRGFLVNVAKIELWLLGLPAKVDGGDDFPVTGFSKPKGRKRDGGRFEPTVTLRNPDLRAALAQFWRQAQGCDGGEAATRAREISPELFAALLNPQPRQGMAVVPVANTDYSSELLRHFEERGTIAADVEEAWRQGRNLGMRLWDGLKRLWRWVRRGISAVVLIGKNLFRAFMRFALKAYKIVRTACSALALSLEQYLAQRLTMPEGNPVTVVIGKDMDFVIALPDKTDSALLAAATQQVQRFSRVFYFASRLLGVFVTVLAGTLGGLSGWVRLLMSLVSGYRALVPAYRELVAVL